MSIHRTIDIDPCGDVLFVFDSESEDSENCSTRMRVNSVPMSLGSPVFKTMLGPHFREGRQLNAATLVEIPLDDSAKSMEIVCMAMHLRFDPPLFHQTPSQVLEIAKVSDKYHCAKALGPLAECWLKSFRSDGGVSSWRDLLAASYLFRRHEPFAKIASHIIQHADEEHFCKRTAFYQKPSIP